MWNLPNILTLLRIGLIPVFIAIYYTSWEWHNLIAAAVFGLAAATDWVDGWVARRFNQVSEFGKMFDPTADRLLFIVGLVAIMIDGSAPLWFCLLVIAREVLFGGTVAILTLFFKMERFDVTYLGKWATFLLMGVFPAFVMNASEIRFHEFFGAAAWIAGPIGLLLSYYTAIVYLPTIRSSLARGRA